MPKPFDLPHRDPPTVQAREEPDVLSDPKGAGNGSAHNATVKVEENN